MPIIWNIPLIVLSVFIAIIGSFTALTHAQRMRENDGRTATIWMLVGGSTLGVAIWSMHFVGMLALHLPIQIGFDMHLTLLSLLPAVIAALLGFYVLREKIIQPRRLLISAIFMGAGISAMHYLGMDALKMSPSISYNPWVFSLSIVIAIVASWGALLIMYRQDAIALPPLLRNILGAVAMGFAIAAMHYTAMLGMNIPEGGMCLTDALRIEPNVMAGMLAMTALVWFGGGSLASVFDQRMTRQNSIKLAELEVAHLALMAESEEISKSMIQALRESEEKFRMTLQNAPDAVFITKRDGEIVYVNDIVIELLGFSREELYRKTVFDLVPDAWREAYRIGGKTIISTTQRHVFEIRFLTKQGFKIPMELNAVLLPNGQVYGSCRDIRERKAAQKELEHSKQNLQRLMDSITEGMYGVDVEGNCTFVNAAFLKILGFSSEAEVMGKNIHSLIHHSHANGAAYPAKECLMYQAFKNEISTHSDSEVFWRKDGVAVPVEYWSHSLVSEGKTIGAVATFLDISERKLAESKLLLSEANAKHMLDELRYQKYALDQHAIVAITDVKGVITYVNEKFCEISGYTTAELVGKNHRIVSSGIHPPSFFHDMFHSIGAGKVWEGEICNRAKDGHLYWVLTTIVPFLNEDGKPTQYISIRTDITERKEKEQHIHQLAFYDVLTGLPNRRLLMERAMQAMSVSMRRGQYAALMLLDLDNFKKLNDSKGHDVGDQLLQEVGARLQRSVRAGDTVARLGGDEFVVVVEGLSSVVEESAIQAELVAENIRSVLSERYDLKTYSHHTSPSIGVVMFRGHQENIDAIFKYADIAMYQAKQAGRNTIRFYDPAMQAAINARIELEAELDVAIQTHQLRLYYQIQVDAQQRPLGAEVLMRWEHPQRGLVSPAQFIPVAEETGQIVAMGLWALKDACQQLKKWQHDKLTCDLTLAVNVSAKQFRLKDFVSQVRHVLVETGAKPSHLKLELTESTVLENVEDTIAKMRELKLLGISFSMDDFGTGYSSLQYLKRLPLDQIKIDQSFVRDITTDPNDAAIVQTIIAMTEAMGLNVIAEGVETKAQQEFLDLRGCHAFQGYFFGKPVPLEKFEDLLLGTKG